MYLQNISVEDSPACGCLLGCLQLTMWDNRLSRVCNTCGGKDTWE